MSIVLTIGVWTLLGLALALIALLAGAFWLGRRTASGRREELRATLDVLPLGVAIFGPDGAQHYRNQLAAELLPLAEGGDVAQLAREATSGRHARLIRGRGEQLVQLQGSRLPTGELLVALRDLSGERRAERGARQLIHTLSHEALTPLTAIQGHLAHIAAVTRPGPEWAGSLTVVRAEVDRLTKLSSNLLLLARLDAGQPLQRRPTNLAALAEETVLQLLERADARGVTLNLRATPQLPRPSVDRDALKQVLLNLIDNGIKYGREGGTVAVDLCAEGGALRLTVSDDGPGIAAGDLPHLFTPLFRGENQNQAGGSGLGLAIVRRIVEAHGGAIECTSTPPHGASFHLRLPVDVTGS